MRHRRNAVAVLALLLTASLAACGGEDSDEEAGGPGAAATSETGEEPDEAETSTGETEETEETEESAVQTGDYEATDEVTPPGTRLEMDDVALVPLPYFPRGVGKYAVRLESVRKMPSRILEQSAVDVPEGLTDLYYVRQTYEMVNPGNARVQGTNLIAHTAGLVDGVEAFDINADLPRCTFGAFFGDVEVGDRRSICMPFVLPAGETLDEVVWYRYDTKYDGLLDGDYVYWSLDG